MISCTQWYLEEDSERGLFIPKLGQLVAVWGKLSEYRDQKQLTVTAIIAQNDPNAEPLHWLEVAYLKKTVYGVPFSLPPGVSVEMQSEFSLRDSTRGTVLRYLNEPFPGWHFTLPQLCADVELQRRCMEGIGGGGSFSTDEVTAALFRAVQELPEMGVVIPAIGTGKQREMKYEVWCRQMNRNMALYVPRIRLVN